MGSTQLKKKYSRHTQLPQSLNGRIVIPRYNHFHIFIFLYNLYKSNLKYLRKIQKKGVISIQNSSSNKVNDRTKTKTTYKQNKEHPQESNSSFSSSRALSISTFFSIYTKKSVSQQIIKINAYCEKPLALFFISTSETSESQFGRYSNREEEFDLYILVLRCQINNGNSLSMQTKFEG